MPCRDWSGITAEDEARARTAEVQRRADKLSSWLCAIMKHADTKQFSREFIDELSLKRKQKRELFEWWEQHKEADRREQERLKKQAEEAQRRRKREAERAAARKKLKDLLTPDELRVLGLD